MVISSACIFLQRSIYPRTAVASIYVTMVGATPYKLFLEGALGQQAACQLWFHFQEEKKGRWCEIWQKMELGEHLDAFFHSKLLKIEAAMAFWVLT